MKKMKRIFALISAILLIGLYISTFVFALMGSELSQNLFMASVALTIILPVLLYAMILIHRLVDKNSGSIDDK